MKRAPPRSLGRWLSWWLAGQTFVGLGVVCVVVYVVAAIARMHGGQTHALPERGRTSIGFDMAQH